MRPFTFGFFIAGFVVLVSGSGITLFARTHGKQQTSSESLGETWTWDPVVRVCFANGSLLWVAAYALLTFDGQIGNPDPIAITGWSLGERGNFHRDICLNIPTDPQELDSTA